MVKGVHPSAARAPFWMRLWYRVACAEEEREAAGKGSAGACMYPTRWVGETGKERSVCHKGESGNGGEEDTGEPGEKEAEKREGEGGDAWDAGRGDGLGRWGSSVRPILGERRRGVDQGTSKGDRGRGATAEVSHRGESEERRHVADDEER